MRVVLLPKQPEPQPCEVVLTFPGDFWEESTLMVSRLSFNNAAQNGIDEARRHNMKVTRIHIELTEGVTMSEGVPVVLG